MIVELVESLRDIAFPPLCACCAEPLTDGEAILCTTCRYDMPITYYHEMKHNYAVDLLAGRIDFVNASALMFFRRDSDYRRLIHRMKYGGRSDVARVLGEIYGRYLRESKLYQEVDLVVPVPLHWSRLIKRGYNQSGEFAEGIARSMNIGVESRALSRVRHTHVQARMVDAERRAKNVSQAFSVRRAELLEGHNVLLVDDVITTGATIESCAEAINRTLPELKLSIGAMAIVEKS